MSASPYQGISILDNFVSNELNVKDGLRGQIPGPPKEALATWTIFANGMWGPSTGAFNFIPVITATGSATGGTGQTFTNPNFGKYTLAQDIQLFYRNPTATPSVDIKLRGAPGGTEFSLLGTTVTVNVNLPANALVWADSKTVQTITDTYRLLTQGNDNITTEAGDYINTQQLTLLELEAEQAFTLLMERLRGGLGGIIDG